MARLVAKFGPQHLTLVEDSVQEAFYRAYRMWPMQGTPSKPHGWLLRVASNLCLDEVRRPATRPIEDQNLPFVPELEPDDIALARLCCHTGLTQDSQVTLLLRLLFGLTPPEIARALNLTVEAVQQRLVRAKAHLASLNPNVLSENPIPDHDVLLRVAYLVYNEGYVATAGLDLVRPELCAHALRFTLRILTTEPTPAGHALAALIFFQSSRLATRTNSSGELVQLKDQDRSQWSPHLIEMAIRHLAASAEGSDITIYHLQAAIASCHAIAPTYDATDWRTLLAHYDHLYSLMSVPDVLLNRAVVLSELYDPETALRQLDEIKSPADLASPHLYHATRADFLTRQSRIPEARTEYEAALTHVQNHTERAFLQSKLQSLPSQTG